MKKHQAIIFVSVSIVVLVLFFGLVFIQLALSTVRNLSASSLNKEANVKSSQVSFGELQVAREDKFLSDLSSFVATNSAIPASSSASLGIAITNLSSNRTYGLSLDKDFELASVEKLLVAAYAFSKIDKSQIKEDTIISGKPLIEHLKFLINQSNNESWAVLTTYFGILQLQDYAKEQGLSSFRVAGGTNLASPTDVNLLLSKIYTNLLKQSSREKLLTFMHNTAFEQRIPQGLPKEALVYHKTGTFDNVINDAGIVVHAKNPYILTVLAQNPASQDKAVNLIQEVSKKVWNFYDSV
jgi:beta-lactamase class A